LNYFLKVIYRTLVLTQYLQIRAASTTVDAVETRFVTMWGTARDNAGVDMALLETVSTVLVSTIFDTIFDRIYPFSAPKV